MKETYIKPDIEIIAFDNKDVITTSDLIDPDDNELEFVTAAVLTECGCYLIV